jgi:hypothetical protein
MALIKDVKTGSPLEYDPKKYDMSKPLVEKLLFSAPEYFVFETRFGGWLISQLVKMLDLLNGLLMTDNSPSSRGYSIKLIRYLSIWLSSLKGWLSNAIKV